MEEILCVSVIEALQAHIVRQEILVVQILVIQLDNVWLLLTEIRINARVQLRTLVYIVRAWICVILIHVSIEESVQMYTILFNVIAQPDFLGVDVNLETHVHLIHA